MNHGSLRQGALAALFGLVATALAACAHPSLDEVESRYADFLDAAGALDTIDSGIAQSIGGKDRNAWADQYAETASFLSRSLTTVATSQDIASQRALAAMQAGFAARTAASENQSLQCADAHRPDLSPQQLSAALYECFSSIGGAIAFEGDLYPRVSALQLLEQLETPDRRQALFLAMSPLWLAVNGDNGPDSPYRRLVLGRAEQMRASISQAEASLGIAAGEGESWLVAALEAWRRQTASGPAIEPWDFRYAYAQGARAVAACAPVDVVRSANERYFADLGAPTATLNAIQDIGDRPGMSPVDFTDFTTIGRVRGGAWRPATVRVSVILRSGGLGAAAELAHEFGHVAHFAAMRARPSLLLPDDLTMTIEAIADITAWSVYEVPWQQRYLGCASSAADGLRARLAPVILDIAWGLFETRLSQDPSLDPNRLWTQITQHYLNVAPHPEWSWWAVRGQLVDEPGYMINYAFGAFVTADLRHRIASRIGAFDAGNPTWYEETSAGLFRQGGAQPPAELLAGYLGGPVLADALLEDIGRLRAK